MSTPDPLDLAARALRHRDRSRAQIAERLEQAGVGESEREAALESLERVGYVDDGRFARARTEALAARGRGDAAIRHDHETSGVNGEANEEAHAGLAPELERARAVVAERGQSATTARYLERNGFSNDAVESALAFDQDSETAGGEAAGV